MIEGLKYVVRGIVFIIYFPLHFIYQIWNLICKAVVWLWTQWLEPMFSWFVNTFIIVPCRGIYQFIILPICVFIWNYLFMKLLWPLLYYGLILPISYIWKYLIVIPISWLWTYLQPILNWIWREIIIVVIHWASVVTKWIFQCLVWLWRYFIFIPLQWFWRFIYPAVKWIGTFLIVNPLRWIKHHIIDPSMKWINSVFDFFNSR